MRLDALDTVLLIRGKHQDDPDIGKYAEKAIHAVADQGNAVQGKELLGSFPSHPYPPATAHDDSQFCRFSHK